MENILVIRFGSLGDVALASAAVEALHRASPSGRIVFLTKSAYASLYRFDPRVERVVGILPGDTPFAIARAAGGGFDTVVDLHATVRSMAVAALVPAKRKVRVKKHSLARRMMVWSRNRFRRRFDTLGAYLDTLRPLGVEGRIMPCLFPGRDALAVAGAFLETVRKEGGRIVGLAPGSRHRTKRWPAGSWARLTEMIAERGDVPIFLGDAADLPVMEEIRLLAKVSVPVPTEMELAATVAVVSLMDGLVTNDSGPMHLAGALGTPFAAIFGPTHPDLGFAPEYPSGIVLHAGLPCSPCSLHGEKPCRLGTLRCMERIGPETALDTLDRVMGRAAGRTAPPHADAAFPPRVAPPC